MGDGQDRKNKYLAVLAGLLLLSAYLLKFRPAGSLLPDVAANCWRGGVYAGVIAVWGNSVCRRVIHPKIRQLFRAISLLMIFWILLQTIKFSVSGYPEVSRCLWYLYYIPMLFIPLLALLISMYLGRTENYRLPEWTRALYPAAALLVLLVLSNDAHQLVFAFPEGEVFSDRNYSYAPLFYPVFAWRLGGLLLTVGMIFARSRVPKSSRRLTLPLVPAALLLLYGIVYITNPTKRMVFLETVAIMESMFEICIFECCLRCGLIQSNTHYEKLFAMLSCPALLVDEAYAPICASGLFAPLDEEQMRRAENGAFERGDGLVLKSMPVKNGHILWTEDVAELASLKKQAEGMTKALAEERELLQAEIEMKQKKEALDTRNRLYDSVARELQSQFAEIDRLLSGSGGREEERQAALRQMCVIGAYVKRRCNLLFISEENPRISAEELAYCLRESADYIRLYGAECVLHAAHTGMVPAESAKLAYDMFERVAETVLETLCAMLIYLDADEGGLHMNIQSECKADGVDFGGMGDAVQRKNGTLEQSREDGILFVRISLPAEGGA